MLYEIPVLIAGALVTASLTLPEALHPHAALSWGFALKSVFALLMMYGLVIAIRELPVLRYRLLFSTLLVLNLLPFVLLAEKAWF